MCVCVCLWWGWWDGNLSTIYLSLCWGSLLLVIYLRPYMLWHWSCVALAICLSIYPSIYLFCMYLHLPWRYYESSLSIHPRLSLSLFMYILVFLSMRWVLDPPILSIHILFYLLLTYSSSIRFIDLSIYQSISMPLTHICLYIGSACEYHGSTLHRSVCLSIYLFRPLPSPVNCWSTLIHLPIYLLWEDSESNLSIDHMSSWLCNMRWSTSLHLILESIHLHPLSALGLFWGTVYPSIHLCIYLLINPYLWEAICR